MSNLSSGDLNGSVDLYSHLDYLSRLNALALMSLEKRRLVQDLVLTYKIIFGLLDIDSHKLFYIRPTLCE